MNRKLVKTLYRILAYAAGLGLAIVVSTLAYHWYFEGWVDNGAAYFDDIKGVHQTNHFKSRGRIDSSRRKQGYWVYWRPGSPIKTEVVEWFGKLKSRKIVSYPGQGKKLKEGYYKDNKMHGFWVFWTKTLQVDRKLTGLYENGKLVRNARDEFFPMPDAGHPFDDIKALLWMILMSGTSLLISALLFMWLLSGFKVTPEE